MLKVFISKDGLKFVKTSSVHSTQLAGSRLRSWPECLHWTSRWQTWQTSLRRSQLNFPRLPWTEHFPGHIRACQNMPKHNGMRHITFDLPPSQPTNWWGVCVLTCSLFVSIFYFYWSSGFMIFFFEKWKKWRSSKSNTSKLFPAIDWRFSF